LIPAVVAITLSAPATAHAYVYWTDDLATTIGQATSTGDPAFIADASGPLAVAAANNQIYWANHGNGTIGTANLDGSGASQDFITGATSVGPPPSRDPGS
jgi:hypothetical protein